MTQNISGNVTNKVRFIIDKKSWDNLALFQKKITNLKRQLGGLNSSIKVNAVVNSVSKVNRAVTRNSISEKKREYDAHIMMYRKHQSKMQQSQNKIRSNIDLVSASAQNRLNPNLQGNVLSSARYSHFKNEMARLNAEYAKHGNIRRYRTEVNHLTSGLLRQERAAKANAISMRSLRGDLIQATAAYTAFSVAANIFTTGKEFDSLQAGMLLFAGNQEGVRDTMTFLRGESERLGINLQQAAEQFTKFSIVSRNKMTQGQREEFFTGLSEYATVMQVDQHRFQRSMMAIQQMMSKGKISSEELRLQLA